MWSKPSIHSRSMNAPKSVRFFTVPVTRSPTFTPSMNFCVSRFAPARSTRAGSAQRCAGLINLNDFEIGKCCRQTAESFAARCRLRRRQKRFHADVHHQSAFDDGFHFAFDQTVCLKDARDLFQSAIGRFLFGKHNHAFIVLERSSTLRLSSPTSKFPRLDSASEMTPRICNRYRPALRAVALPKCVL